MRTGDTVEVDGVRGKVLDSSDITTLDWERLSDKKQFWIGVSPYGGNPRVVVVKRGKGKRVQTAEWCR